VSLTVAACADDLSDAAPSTTVPLVTQAPTTTEVVLEPLVVDIVATALKTTMHSQLAGMVVDAGLVDTLRSPGPFTVFAPTDDAFDKIPVDALHGVQDDPDLLATVLTYHVVPGALKAADLQPGKLTTVAGIDLEITKQGDQVLVNGFPIAVADVEATNGIIHVMGDVLLPPS
jgi:uncharacterized surface protein with fasciclin (FAS1) repeats